MTDLNTEFTKYRLDHLIKAYQVIGDRISEDIEIMEGHLGLIMNAQDSLIELRRDLDEIEEVELLSGGPVLSSLLRPRAQEKGGDDGAERYGERSRGQGVEDVSRASGTESERAGPFGTAAHLDRVEDRDRQTQPGASDHQPSRFTTWPKLQG